MASVPSPAVENGAFGEESWPHLLYANMTLDTEAPILADEIPRTQDNHSGNCDVAISDLREHYCRN